MQSNQDVAASLNLEWDKLELNGGLTGRFNQASGSSWSNSQNFENRNAAYSNRISSNGSHSNSFDTNWRIEWKPDTMTNILLRPQFGINGNRSHSRGESATFNDNPYAVTDDPLGAFSAISTTAPDGSPVGISPALRATLLQLKEHGLEATRDQCQIRGPNQPSEMYPSGSLTWGN